jgi:hypothetical protein
MSVESPSRGARIVLGWNRMRALMQMLLPFLRPAEITPADAGASPRKPNKRTQGGAKRGEPRPVKTASATAVRQARYDALVDEMKAAHGFRVRAWRRSMSGCAWEVVYRDGRRQRMLESPYPKSPLSCAIFLHEVGHHAIGLGVVRPRCLEELRAWQWSLATMEEQGLVIDERVRDRFRRSMEYAVAKAARRGIKSLPAELTPYLPKQA